MAADEYEKFRNATGCGWINGTVWTGPQICDKPAKFTVDDGGLGLVVPTVNGKVCGIHVRKALSRGFVAEPIKEETK